jgi:Domain of unknown function (DUF4258)
VSETFRIVKALVEAGKFRVSFHGDEEMREDRITPKKLVDSVSNAVVVEDYPDAWKGPTVLLLQEYEGHRFHVIWGLSKAAPDVATLVTAYVPEPGKWTPDLLKRLKS